MLFLIVRAPRLAAGLVTTLLLSGACSSNVTIDGTGGNSSTSASSTQQSTSSASKSSASAGTGGEACALTQLPLIVDQNNGVPDRLHVAIGYNGQPALLFVDTGSGLTFLQEPLGSPDSIEHAATFQIGCLNLDVIGRPEIPDGPINGVPSVGTLGTDLLTKGPTEIDLAGAQLLFNQPGVPFTTASEWPNAPFDLITGGIIPHVELDGVPVRLIMDTGSQDTLWVGQDPKPGDVEVDAEDAYGNIVKLYQGTVELTLGDKQITVPVLRAPSFPSFQPPQGVVGLLGMSSLGQGVVIDTDAMAIRVDL